MRRTVSVAGLALLLTTGLGWAELSAPDIVDAAKRGDGHAVHRILEAHPESVDTTDATGYTALHWAGIRGHWRIFAELVAAGAPVSAVGGDGGTPLHWACHHDNAEAIAALLDAGADACATNRWGRTPLHVAARRGCTEVVELLIERGADLEARTKEGWTPLHVASMSDHPKVIVALMLSGADPVALDGDGHTPAEVARRRPSAVEIDPAFLDDFVGIYDLGGGVSSKVWREGDRLRIREFAADEIYAIGEDAFFCRSEPWRVEFNRAESGEVDSIVLHFLRRSVTGTKTPSPRYVGSAACKDCHSESGKASPAVVWMRSRHGHAYWRLGADWALFLARLRPHYSDLTDPISDDRCLLCHVTGRQDDDALLAESFRDEDGVGCESCHGPGSLYIDPEIMADHEAFLTAGGHTPDETTCRSCHRNSEQFDWDEMWSKIAHVSD